MLFSLLSLVLFGLILYFLWLLWCRFAPNLVAQNAPDCVKRPNIFLFLFVTLIVLLIYRRTDRR